jgi:Bacterial transcriptional activator domain
LVALDPMREDRQRNALTLLARHKGREAAMGKAKQLLCYLRVELDVPPEAATRALIDSIKRGDFEPGTSPPREQPAAQGTSLPGPTANTAACPLPSVADSAVHAKPAIAVTQTPSDRASASFFFRRRVPHAARRASVALASLVAIALLALAIKPNPRPTLTSLQRGQAAAVLPFVADNSGQPTDPAFAQVLTHDLIGYLSRFDNF